MNMMAELEAIYQGMADGILIVDAVTMRIRRANLTVCQMLGYTAEELMGMSVCDLHPNSEQDATKERLATMCSQPMLRFENIPFQQKDGSVFFAEVTATPLIFQGQQCLMGFIRDSTERTRSLDRVRQSEQLYRLIAENITDVICTADFDQAPAWLPDEWPLDHARVADWILEHWRFTFVSPSVEQVLGYSPHEVMALRIEEFVASPSLHVIRQTMIEQLTQPGDLAARRIRQRRLEVQCVAKGGVLCWCEVTSRFLRDSRGQITGALAVLRDISLRKEAESAVEREQQVLRRLFDLQERDRQWAAYEIHDKFAQQTTGALFHLQGFREMYSRDPATAWRMFDTSVQLLTEGIDGTRRLISALRPPILDERGLVAAAEYLAHELSLLTGTHVELVHHVAFDRLPGPLESALFRIIQEAVANACRHSGSHTVLIDLRQTADTLRLTVRDWGRGFDAASIAEGSFGLQGIRQRVRLLKGNVEIRTAPQRGTQIIVELPLSESARLAPGL